MSDDKPNTFRRFFPPLVMVAVVVLMIGLLWYGKQHGWVQAQTPTEAATHDYLARTYNDANYTCEQAEWHACPTNLDLDAIADIGWRYARIKEENAGRDWRSMPLVVQRGLALDQAVISLYVLMWGSKSEGIEQKPTDDWDDVTRPDHITFVACVAGLKSRIDAVGAP